MSDTSNPAAIGISISANRLRVAALDINKVIIDRVETVLSSDLPVKDQIEALIVSDFVAGVSRVCVSVPGLVETGTSKIVDSRIQSLVGVDLKTELGSVCPDILIENDANAAAFAEYAVGAGRGSRNLFCIVLGEGVGSGLILDGAIWRGANGFAGEFGAIVVDEEGTRLEDVASIPNIVRRTRARFHRDSTSTLGKLKEDEISFEDILAAAELGDDFAQLMLERTGTYVGTALAAAINLLNIDKVVLAGEVIRTPSAVLDAATRRARECSASRAFGAVEIDLSQLDEYASAIGGALIAAEARQ